MVRHIPLILLSLLAGCGAKSATQAELETGTWASSAADCGISYLTFDHKRITNHTSDGQSHPMVDITISTQEKDPRVVALSFRLPNDSNAARSEVSKSLDGKTIAFLVTNGHLEAIIKVWGDKGELGGPIRRTDPLYQFFNRVRCPQAK